MNSEEKKLLISETDVFDKATLQETLTEILSREEVELAKDVSRVLENNRII
jgi:hypothetical protein